MSPQDQILQWSNDQPLWRRDALRRLLTGAFSAADEDEIFELLKAEYKLTTTAMEARPLLAEHIPNVGTSSEKIALLGISNVRHANMLAPGQTLPFAATGITLVYGDNGSGKSGYARILKKACRARVVETILNNVFDDSKSKEPPSATFQIVLGDKASEPVEWSDGNAGPPELARIAVFDSKCASVYVDSENQAVFIPYNLDCFERLAKLCDQLKEQLAEESRTVAAAISIPVLSLVEGTEAHAFMADLAAKTDNELGAASVWSQADTERLAELATLVTDPEKHALELRQLYAQVKSIRDIIVGAAPNLSQAAIEGLRSKKLNMKAAQEANRLAASRAFNEEPLGGVGSSAWRQLYEAARAFSQLEAYKGHSFPIVEGETRCVLCQQFLDHEAKERLTRFNQFIQGEATKKADAATVDWETDIRAFRDGTNGIAALSATTSRLIEKENIDVGIAIAGYLTKAVALRKAIEEVIVGDSTTPLPEIPSIDTREIDIFLDGVKNKAAAMEAAVKDENATKLRKELTELQARKQLHDNKEQVVKRLSDLRLLKKLDGAMKACVTTGISQKGTELLKQHVSGEFETALNCERKALGIERIPLRVNSRSPKGTPSHQLKLDKSTFAGNTSAILSEGEHRAVALASFLAEQEMVLGNAPIIIDDPVSSLDHERRLRVAQRLVKEAQKRQVIVFTHDLLFYTDATFIAAEKQVPISKIGVRRGPSGYGTVEPDGDPWTAKTLGKRRSWLEQQLVQVRRLYEQGQPEDYERETRFFYDRLRESWERLIEEGLFANVVVRYRRSVETRRLPEAVIDDVLVSRVYNGMTAISTYTAHDRPTAAGSDLPDPDTMKQHLDDFVSCLDAIDVESKAARKRREKLEKPPVPIKLAEKT